MADSNARRSSFHVFACFALGIAVGFVPWLFRHRFYFHDDMQHQHMPTFLHIGRLLRAGELPILTLASFSGGNLLGEYQFGVLNPVSLALYAVLPSIANFEIQALFLACFYYGVLSSGTYVLARAYGVGSSAAIVAAVVIATNNLICYWFASSWFPIFVSIAWLVWAWAFLARAGRSRADWVLAVVFCYLTITSGWPHTTIVLGFVAIAVAAQNWKSVAYRGGAAAVTTLAALGAATLLASVTLLGLASMGEVAARFSGLVNGNVFVPNLRDLLAMSSPFHRGFMSWGGYKLTGTPLFALAWFLMPLLPLIQWRMIEWRRPEVLALLVIGGFCLLGTQGPEEFYMLRWPFRWIPYFHIATVVLFLLMVSRAGFAPLTIGRLLIVLLLVALSGISSWQADPGSWRIHLGGIAGCAFGLVAFLAIPERAKALRLSVLGGGSLLFFIATHAVFRGNPDIPDYGLPARVEGGLPANAAPEAYTLYLGWLGDPADAERLDEFRTGMMPRARETATLNGYTPIGHRFGSDWLCMNMFGETCPELGPHLFDRDPVTGIPYADMLRINRLVVMKGPHLSSVRPALNASWRLEYDGPRTQRFVRALPNATLPGTVAWVSQNASVAPAGPPHPTKEQVRVTRSGPNRTTVIFARLWWPGYQAEFNGREVPVRAYRDFLVAADLPAGADSGVLTLRFRPPYLNAGLAAMLAGFAVIRAVLAFPGLFGLGQARRWRSAELAPIGHR
jgi:hypothetical protein